MAMSFIRRTPMKKSGYLHLNRREFLKSLLGAVAGLGLARLQSSPAFSQDDPPPVFLPLVANNTSPSFRGRVVHVHAANATNWDFDAAHYYGRTQAPGVVGANQSVVDAMIDR